MANKLIFLFPIFLFALCSCDNSEIIKLKATNNALSESINDLSQKNNDLNDKLTALDAELIALKNSKKDLSKNFNDINTKNLQLNEEISTLKSSFADLERTLNESEEENKRLKEENLSLRTENKILKENDQACYNKAIELFKTSKVISDFEKAEKAFDSLIEKFPSSQYLKNAKFYKTKIKEKIKYLEKLKEFEDKYTSFINKKEWNSALIALENSKKFLTNSDYIERKKFIEFEKNKPVLTTINRLKADVGSAKKDLLNPDRYISYKNNEHRVKLVGYMDGDYCIDRNRESFKIRMHSGLVANGETIEVFYNALDDNQKNYFIDGNFDTSGFKYIWEVEVVGIVHLYTNADIPYIVAEKVSIKRNSTR